MFVLAFRFLLNPIVLDAVYSFEIVPNFTSPKESSWGSFSYALDFEISIGNHIVCMVVLVITIRTVFILLQFIYIISRVCALGFIKWAMSSKIW